MAMVEITLEIPLEVQEDLERIAKLGILGRGPIGVAERILAQQVPTLARLLCGDRSAPEPRGIIPGRSR